jgi:AsmA protein
VSLVVPSLARFAAWTGAPFGDGRLVGAGSIAGRMSLAAGMLNLGEATVDFDGNAGEGALTATMIDGKPSLQGTLDFARFDLTPYLAAVSDAVDADGAWLGTPIRLPLLDAAHVDLRLSAGQAVAGATEIGPVAASLLVKQGKLLVDVGEAHLGGGLVEASVSAEMVGSGLAGKISIKIENLPAQTAVGLFGIAGVTGIASATVDLAGTGVTWGDLFEDLAGAASVNLVEGTVDGFDLKLLPQMVADPSAVPEGGSTSFAVASGTFAVGDGVVATQDLTADGPAFELALTGRAWVAAPAIEARGVLTVLGEPPQEVPFLVNGTWRAPRVLPDLGGPLPRDDGGRADSPLPTDG